MFGRTVQLDVVRKNVRGEAAPKKPDPNDISEYVAAAVVATKQIGGIILAGVATYMILDATRSIAVNRLSK